MNQMLELNAHGQSCWMDDLTRGMITNGELEQRVADGLRGITSNPTIFEKAIVTGDDYDRDIARAVAEGRSIPKIYDELITTDVRHACDILRPIYDQSGGTDGFVSLEVSPHLSHATQASIDEARRLSALVNRPNVLIKIPGTVAGVPAIEQLLFEGININITLLFSIASYEAVAEGYLRALERRVLAGRSIDGVTSVASFFLSRIDALVDQLLRQRIVPNGSTRGEPDPKRLLGKAAIANAKLAYQRFRRILESDRWNALAGKGAQVQRMLWASTSTKNPAYHDLMYVEPLVGPLTVNTMPQRTIAALLDHGVIDTTLEERIEEAHVVMANLDRVGVRFEQVTAQLEHEGIQKFIDPFDSLMNRLAAKRREHVRGSSP
ncbi:MAG: transaldolase [Vicinamibacteraceae bacterium]